MGVQVPPSAPISNCPDRTYIYIKDAENPICDTFYICKSLGTGHSQQQIGSSLLVFAAIEIAALANIHFPGRRVGAPMRST